MCRLLKMFFVSLLFCSVVVFPSWVIAQRHAPQQAGAASEMAEIEAAFDQLAAYLGELTPEMRQSMLLQQIIAGENPVNQAEDGGYTHGAGSCRRNAEGVCGNYDGSCRANGGTCRVFRRHVDAVLFSFSYNSCGCSYVSSEAQRE